MKSTLKIAIMSLFLNVVLLAQNDNSKLVEKINDSTYRIDNIKINSNKMTVEFPGWINMTKGLIEVMVCAPGGKDHESIIMANVVPSYLNSALLLLGLESDKNLNYDPRSINVVGPPVDIFVEWKYNGETKKLAAENLLMNIADSSSVENIDWVYTGSFSRDGHYAADNVKSLITTYNDLTTIIDNGSASGSDDTLFEANNKIVPPVDTDVKIIIQLKKE